MNHLVFSDYTIGQSHIKEGMNCEDHAEHYMDPKGRYEIMAVCDGHSDPKCFRSAKGAELGCAAVVEILKNLFEEYFSEDAPDALERFFAEKEETAGVSGRRFCRNGIRRFGRIFVRIPLQQRNMHLSTALPTVTQCTIISPERD